MKLTKEFVRSFAVLLSIAVVVVITVVVAIRKPQSNSCFLLVARTKLLVSKHAITVNCNFFLAALGLYNALRSSAAPQLRPHMCAQWHAACAKFSCCITNFMDYERILRTLCSPILAYNCPLWVGIWLMMGTTCWLSCLFMIYAKSLRHHRVRRASPRYSLPTLVFIS